MRLLILLFLPFILFSQEDSVPFARRDSNIFMQDEMLWLVKNYHPVAIQANILLERGESEVRASRGGFDPYLHLDYEDKFYDDKNYFNILNGGLKVPTWYGVELKTGIDQNEGVFLNPEDNVPDGGLWYGGVSVSLGSGLFIDERRASLQQAKIFAQSTYSEQQQIMNTLYFEALSKYWKWVAAWNDLEVLKEGVELAEFRYEGVRQSYSVGDVPAIDTLEALIQVQNRQIDLNDASVDFQNATLELSNYLWFENNTPLEISDSLRPPFYEDVSRSAIISLDSLDKQLNQLEFTHPEMQLYDFKLSTMDIDRRLKAEKLKPKLNVNYNFLNETVGDEFFSTISTENYKWGVGFSIPLFLREERGSLQLSKLKIRETELDQDLTLYKLKNNLKGFYNDQLNIDKQVTLYTNAVANYKRLLDGERKKFEIGESSLFLVNSRETKLIESQIKLIKLIAKYKIVEAGLKRATGYLYIK